MTSCLFLVLWDKSFQYTKSNLYYRLFLVVWEFSGSTSGECMPSSRLWRTRLTDVPREHLAPLVAQVLYLSPTLPGRSTEILRAVTLLAPQFLGRLTVIDTR